RHTRSYGDWSSDVCSSDLDIIKQKLPENNGGYKVLKGEAGDYGKTDERVYTQLTSDHPIDLCRYQLANCYMGRAGLINSGGASRSEERRVGKEGGERVG